MKPKKKTKNKFCLALSGEPETQRLYFQFRFQFLVDVVHVRNGDKISSLVPLSDLAGVTKCFGTKLTAGSTERAQSELNKLEI